MVEEDEGPGRCPHWSPCCSPGPPPLSFPSPSGLALGSGVLSGLTQSLHRRKFPPHEPLPPAPLLGFKACSLPASLADLLLQPGKASSLRLDPSQPSGCARFSHLSPFPDRRGKKTPAAQAGLSLSLIPTPPPPFWWALFLG